MCFEEILKECHKEARRNGLKLVPERMAGLYSVADKAAELQSAITADELTSHEDGAEAHADTNTSTSEDTPNTIEYVQDARDFIAALSRKELEEFGHDEINGADQMIVALNAIEQLAKHDNAAAWECYGDFMESNLCGASFKIES